MQQKFVFCKRIPL